MTVYDLLYHMAVLAREGRGDTEVVISHEPGHMKPIDGPHIVRRNLVPEDRVQFVQDYIETVVLS